MFQEPAKSFDVNILVSLVIWWVRTLAPLMQLTDYTEMTKCPVTALCHVPNCQCLLIRVTEWSWKASICREDTSFLSLNEKGILHKIRLKMEKKTICLDWWFSWPASQTPPHVEFDMCPEEAVPVVVLELAHANSWQWIIIFSGILC